MFQKSPAQTAFWTFIESSRYITGLVIQMDGFPVDTVSFFVTIYQANIFGEKPKFKPNIFGGTPTFQKFYFR
jgi:hypothetical protein